MPDLPRLLLVSVGNTRTRYALASGDQLEPSASTSNSDLPSLLGELQAAAEGGARVLLASVNNPVADQIEARLGSVRDGQAGGAGIGRAGSVGGHGGVVRLGRDLPIPVEHTLDQPVTVGHDRLLNALGAYSRSEQACIVIDAGTAVTVDFVDGAGVFHGGAIAPGITMMLRALHEHTAALPAIELSPALLPGPGLPPFGRSTPQAMTIGAVAAVRGLAYHLIDRYAEFYQAYPRVIATGGDAPLLFDNDALVEAIVPDLTLVGIHTACKIALSADQDD